MSCRLGQHFFGQHFFGQHFFGQHFKSRPNNQTPTLSVNTALLVLLARPAWTRIIPTDLGRRAHKLRDRSMMVVSMIAIWTMHVTDRIGPVVVVMSVVAIWTMHVWLGGSGFDGICHGQAFAYDDTEYERHGPSIDFLFANVLPS
jgi:hypothetical protein